MNETKEFITANDLEKAIRELLKENVVGYTEAETESGFIYRIPGGKRYEITVKEA